MGQQALLLVQLPDCAGLVDGLSGWVVGMVSLVVDHLLLLKRKPGEWLGLAGCRTLLALRHLV